MKWILWISVVFLTLVGCQSKEEDPPPPLVDVAVATAEEADVVVSVRAPATVFPREVANISARLTAPIREMRVRKGDNVGHSQVLAILENRDLMAQRAEAAATLADAEATLAKMSTGTLPTDVERARGQEATTLAALNQAEKFYERRKQLFEQGAIPARDLLLSETELAQAKANHDVAAKALRLLENQSMERDLEIARSRVEQARGRLAFVEAQISYSELRSPFGGTITEQFLFPGDMAKPDTPIVTVADLSVAVARAQIPEASAAEVRKGEDCSLTPADRPAVRYKGSITVVNRAVDPLRRTVEVWCEIPNGTQELRAGVFGTAAVETGLMRKAVVVPVTALQFEEGTSQGTITLVDAGRKVQKKLVETAPASEGKVAVLSGISAGDTVIVQGGYGLEDGTEVRWEGAPKP